MKKTYLLSLGLTLLFSTACHNGVNRLLGFDEKDAKGQASISTPEDVPEESAKDKVKIEGPGPYTIGRQMAKIEWKIPDVNRAAMVLINANGQESVICGSCSSGFEWLIGEVVVWYNRPYPEIAPAGRYRIDARYENYPMVKSTETLAQSKYFDLVDASPPNPQDYRVTVKGGQNCTFVIGQTYEIEWQGPANDLLPKAMGFHGDPYYGGLIREKAPRVFNWLAGDVLMSGVGGRVGLRLPPGRYKIQISGYGVLLAETEWLTLVAS